MSRIQTLLPLLAAVALAAGCGGESPEATTDMQKAQAGANQAPDPACRPNQTPTSGPVRISLDGQGGVEVAPLPVKLAVGTGSVEFTSDLPFALIFHPRNGNLPTRAPTASVPAGGRAPVRANPGIGCGRYEFSVAVWDAGSQRVVPLDPPIDIVPVGGGTDSLSTN